MAGRGEPQARHTGLPLLHLASLYLPLGAGRPALDSGLKHPGQPATRSRSDPMNSGTRGVSDQGLGKWPRASQPQHPRQLELQTPGHGCCMQHPKCAAASGCHAGGRVCRGGFCASLISSSPQNHPSNRRYAPKNPRTRTCRDFMMRPKFESKKKKKNLGLGKQSCLCPFKKCNFQR